MLFGLESSNRNFKSKDAWGKNVFNSSFPAAMCCYLHSEGKKACYIVTTTSGLDISEIPIQDIFRIDPRDKNTYFAFEAEHSPYHKYVTGKFPRTDLVVQNKATGACVAGLEIKLTALPDNTTCNSKEGEYGSEIVVRPDTITYLACSIADALGPALANTLDGNFSVRDWEEPSEVLPYISEIVTTINKLSKSLTSKQSPFLLQPIWKTLGKSPALAEHCMDVFCWSNASMAFFMSCIANPNPGATSINRPTRAAIWLYKMLLDIKDNNRFDAEGIIDRLTYNTKNDKAFSSIGKTTNKYMKCQRLTKPVIRKSDIKNIILGGGQHLLSPERRLDAIIYNTAELFH